MPSECNLNAVRQRAQTNLENVGTPAPLKIKSLCPKDLLFNETSDFNHKELPI